MKKCSKCKGVGQIREVISIGWNDYKNNMVYVYEMLGKGCEMMIDKSKNHTYIITIHYHIRNGEGVFKRQSKRFTSNHSLRSKPFQDFLADKLKGIKGFAFLDEEWGEQYTIPLSDFCK